MAITLTEVAADRVRTFLENRGKGVGLHLGIKTHGCSGMAYVMEFADEIGNHDEVVDLGDMKILIDPKAIMFILGTEMDFVEEKLSSGFVFRNPNEKGRCGCGESFHV